MKLQAITYEEPYIVRPIRRNGIIRWKNREVFITEVLRHQAVGLLQGGNNTLEVYFGSLHLGTVDCQSAKFIPKRL